MSAAADNCLALQRLLLGLLSSAQQHIGYRHQVEGDSQSPEMLTSRSGLPSREKH
jgi:hypothetical protein